MAGYTPKSYSKPTAPAAETSAPTKAKVPVAGSLHVTPNGEKKGERVCNLFLNEKNGKRWLSGKAEDGTRFSIFLNDEQK